MGDNRLIKLPVCALVAVVLGAFAAPALAQDRSNVGSARAAAQACITLHQGQAVDGAAMARVGLNPARQGFLRRPTTLDLAGHTDRAEVKFRDGRCTYSFGSDRRASTAFEAFAGAFRAAGLTEGRSARMTAFQVGGRWVTVFGTSGSQNGSFFTRISTDTR